MFLYCRISSILLNLLALRIRWSQLTRGQSLSYCDTFISNVIADFVHNNIIELTIEKSLDNNWYRAKIFKLNLSVVTLNDLQSYFVKILWYIVFLMRSFFGSFVATPLNWDCMDGKYISIFNIQLFIKTFLIYLHEYKNIGLELFIIIRIYGWTLASLIGL